MRSVGASDYLRIHHFTKLNTELKELSAKSILLKPVIRSLKNLQTLDELLMFVSNICKKYGLNWWLDGGNLLGAVRYENFITGDDDMDIAMM